MSSGEDSFSKPSHARQRAENRRSGIIRRYLRKTVAARQSGTNGEELLFEQFKGLSSDEAIVVRYQHAGGGMIWGDLCKSGETPGSMATRCTLKGS